MSHRNLELSLSVGDQKASCKLSVPHGVTDEIVLEHLEAVLADAQASYARRLRTVADQSRNPPVGSRVRRMDCSERAVARKG